MNNSDPILIIHRKRLGDIVMSFPLFLWLKKQFPNSPLWVLAEPLFFQGVLKIFPDVLYVPWQERAILLDSNFSIVINLDNDNESATLVGNIKSKYYYGLIKQENGDLKISGDWHLYRHSLVGSSFNNRFHWSDLYSLDTIGYDMVSTTKFSFINDHRKSTGVIGIVVSASQKEKSFNCNFTASLVQELKKREISSVLIGGPNEIYAGNAITKQCNFAVENLCGKFSVDKLVSYFSNLDLLITPDTGPMHLAAWSGLQVLNLSVGPVNPWETGPYYPGHYVLRPKTSCRYCWECHRIKSACQYLFDTTAVSHVARRLISSKKTSLCNAPKLVIYRTQRDIGGLFDLERLTGQPQASDFIGQFWKGFFVKQNTGQDIYNLSTITSDFSTTFPLLFDWFSLNFKSFYFRLLKSISNRKTVSTEDIFRTQPPALNPFVLYVRGIFENNEKSMGTSKIVAMLESARKFIA